MADAAATASTPKGKTPKKAGAGKAKKATVAAAHPPYAAMVKSAVKHLKERNGSSRQAILKYILANYKVGDEKKAGVRLRMALKKGVTSGALRQAKGAGASGSFKLPEKTTAAAGTKKAAKKPAAKKSPKKKAAAKKPAGEKVAKPKKAKSPKKPKAAKPKKAKTPKKPAAEKVAKPAKKSPAKKAATKKKSAAKKVAAKK